jgi:hypothetical protein
MSSCPTPRAQVSAFAPVWLRSTSAIATPSRASDTCEIQRPSSFPALVQSVSVRRAICAAAATAAGVVLCLGTPVMPVLHAQAGTSEVYPAALSKATAGSPVADLAGVFASRQEERLVARLDAIEANTGFKVRVLTQSNGSAPGPAIKCFFNLDDNFEL